jgi:hypothetical protein
MKVGRVEVGRGVTVGAFATVLYDTQVGDYAHIRLMVAKSPIVTQSNSVMSVDSMHTPSPVRVPNRVKWLLMGAYRPGMHPMWSWWAMRTEAVAVMYWGLGGEVADRHAVELGDVGRQHAHALAGAGAEQAQQPGPRSAAASPLAPSRPCSTTPRSATTRSCAR